MIQFIFILPLDKMTNTTPLFVAFEGIDGSGKTEQLGQVAKHLTEHSGLKILNTREPWGDDARIRIKNTDLPPLDQIQLIAEDRKAHCNWLREVWGDYDLILCDRFTASTLAYQGYGEGLEIEGLIRVNETATQGLKPDLVLLLDCPVNVSVNRLNRSLDKIEKNIHFLNRVRFGYLALAHRFNYQIIDASKNKGNVFTDVLISLSKLMKSSWGD
jgi:dTMP kinase